MLKKTNQLPYFHIKNTKETNDIARFLLKKVRKILLKRSPLHYLIFSRQDKRLEYIKKMSEKYPYFLRFDVEKYYPSINHIILLNNLRGWNISRRMRHYLKHEIPHFLNKNPMTNRGMSLGNYLSWVLAGFYLLSLDLKIPAPFLRVQDDYLIFCKNKKDPKKILQAIIEPELEKIKLQINVKKMSSGKFHQNPVEFMGFTYHAGFFAINEEKKENFQKKITRITHLARQKEKEVVVKLLNNKILGFGHYYKFAQCKQDFKELDMFIRQRLRRYLIRNKDQKDKTANLLLTNQQLKNIGLRSLIDIKQKYARKKKPILLKTSKISNKNGKFQKKLNWLELEEKGHKYEQKVILTELGKLTSLVEKLEKQIRKIEKKL